MTPKASCFYLSHPHMVFLDISCHLRAFPSARPKHVVNVAFNYIACTGAMTRAHAN